MAAIYYPFTVPPHTGGDFVNLEHVEALARAGFDAKVLYCAEDDGLAKFPVPVVRLGQVALKPDDVLVISEIHRELLNQARGINIRRVLHNQGPYNSFYGFSSVQEFNTYPLDHVLVNSDFCAAKLKELGVTHPMTRVRPAVPDYFRAATKYLAIAYAPSKRPLEALFLPHYFRSQAPEFAGVTWMPLSGKPRRECAAILGMAAIFASFALWEGLGLMNLEAMASGCHVVGYTGEGGKEFATAENGDWIAEGDHARFVAALKAACADFRDGGGAKARAGRATAGQFSTANFEQELLHAWQLILGENIGRYRR
ncbi:MAG TPA: glycosyltransferase [Rhizomicrobium sp.]|nr:glycosyltransferase [Rhizomicrobium sp.]